MITPRVTAEVAQRLNELANGDLISYHQYLDFVLCRSFRRTLLCNRALHLQRDALVERIRKLWIASPVVRSAELSDGGYDFRSPSGTSTYTTKDPIILPVLDHLQTIWPHAERFDLLLERISKGLPAELRQRAVENLGQVLLVLAARAVVDLRSYPIPVAEMVTSHPTATPLGRIQAQEGALVTTLLHTQVEIRDEQVRFLLQLLDGSRDRNALIKEFVSHYPDVNRQGSGPQLDAVLNSFHRLGILSAS